jgi:hypothetical protein
VKHTHSSLHIRRQVKKKPPADDDREYFRTHTHRRHRVRLANTSETEIFDAIATEPLPDECFLWMAVKQIEPGHRVKLSFGAPLPPGPIDGIDEATARRLFEHYMERARPLREGTL